MKPFLWCLVACAAALAGCRRPADDVVVFVVDSPVSTDFLAGRVEGLRAADVSHGSLVARVVRRYSRARIRSASVEDPLGRRSPGAYLAALRRVADYARAHPEQRIVVNVSLSSDEADSAEQALVEELDALGALVVAAAGNSGDDTPHWPAAYPTVVGVAGATVRGRTATSSFGEHVEVAASDDITFIDYEFLPFERLRREMQATGTSFAAPRVAAAVAIVLAARPEATPREAWEFVASTAAPVPAQGLGVGLVRPALVALAAAPARTATGFLFVATFVGAVGWVSLGLLRHHGAPGVFLVLLLVLVVVPVLALLAVAGRDGLAAVGGGSEAAGALVLCLLAAGILGVLALQDGSASRALVSAGVPYGLHLVVPVAWARTPGRQLALAGGAAVAAVAVAAAWRALVRRRIARLVLQTEEGRLGAAGLARAYDRAVDERVRRAVVRLMARAGGPGAVDFLLSRTAYANDAVAGLSELLRADPAAGAHALARSRPLSPGSRGRLARAYAAAAGELGVDAVKARLEADAGPGAAAGLEELLNAEEDG